jgi:hypothetical protein
MERRTRGGGTTCVTARVAVLLVLAALILTGCLGGADASESQPTAGKTRSARPAAAARATKGICPLTLPNGSMPPVGRGVGANHGNGKLWTAMWPNNVVIATPHYIEADGSVGMKWAWWRGVNGKLTISGRRLDGRAPPLTAAIPDYGNSGFQPSGISFPTEGCWEVTGAVGAAKLTFVTLVLKASRYWPLGEDS